MAETPEASASLRDIGPADLHWLLTLNNASVPHVNHLERDDLKALLDLAAYARCSLQDDRPAGALIGLWPGTTYASANYLWFSEHHQGFLYIDRVMIDPSVRKGGHGRRLYADIEHFAQTHGAGSIALEVNSQPPNPVSMHFHKALGFRSVGELAHDDGSKCVCLMMKTIG